MDSADDIIIKPGRGKGEVQLPKTGLLLINPTDYFSFSHSILTKSWQRQVLFNSNLHISPDQTSFVAGPAVGAPMAVMCLEKLVALGAEEIIVLSWCGGLEKDDQIGDVVVVNTAIVGEGTSQYYTVDSMVGCADTLTVKVVEMLAEEDVPFRYGRCWSTDAPFRESRNMVRNLQQKDRINCLDMEISALMNVAKFRNIRLAGVFIISDLPLAVKWVPGFKSKLFKKQVRKLLNMLVKQNCNEGMI